MLVATPSLDFHCAPALPLAALGKLAVGLPTLAYPFHVLVQHGVLMPVTLCVCSEQRWHTKAHPALCSKAPHTWLDSVVSNMVTEAAVHIRASMWAQRAKAQLPVAGGAWRASCATPPRYLP